MRTFRLEDCIRTCRKIVELDPSSARRVWPTSPWPADPMFREGPSGP
jgi:hypothetical protein